MKLNIYIYIYIYTLIRYDELSEKYNKIGKNIRIVPIKEKRFINILLMIWKFLMILMKVKKSDGKTSDYEEKSNEEFLKKILMKKILVKKTIFYIYIKKW